MQSISTVHLPGHGLPAPRFETERFILVPLTPPELRALAEVLLKDAVLAEAIPWMEDKTADGAVREAFLLEMQCARGTTKAWGIIDRDGAMFVGTVLTQATLGGIDINVLCASQFWNQGVADEVSMPVEAWLEDNIEVKIER